MDQIPTLANNKNENKNAINMPPAPSASPVSSGSSVPPVVQSAQSSVQSELENKRLDLENTPVPEVISKPTVNADMRSSGQQFKLASTEVQGPKPPLVSGSGSKYSLIAIAAILIIIAGIGGYYFYTKDNNLEPVNSPVIITPAITPIADKNLDTDKDGLPDRIEKILGTYVTKADTDGDGYNDLQELKSGYSPLIAGAAGKYTPEEWANVKGKIKIEDREFYDREFGAPAVTPSPIPEASSVPSPTVSSNLK